MRTLFNKGEQNKLINRILSRILVEKAAKLCNLSERTIRDWRREKFLADFSAIQKLCAHVRISLPRDIKLKSDYWYVSKGASAGGAAVWKKYHRIGGGPNYLKKKWYEWWERDGRHRKSWLTTAKPVHKPPYSKELAEFVGIILGDGGITKYQVVVTLHAKDDRAYSKFIINLVKKLFDIPVSINYDKRFKAVDLVISRRELVRFCVEKLGLKDGNKVKHQVDIPNWIKGNKQYAIACVRGLIDTDGSVFIHRYKVNDKFYEYKKLSFTNHSWPLLRSVFNILKGNGLNPRITQERDVRLSSIKDMRQYFKIFNSHNPKYLKKYYKKDKLNL